MRAEPSGVSFATQLKIMATKTFKIGQIVPSSNTTMETEIPAMLRAREETLPERFTFHSSRMRMKSKTVCPPGG
jgi:maleate isomerase